MLHSCKNGPNIMIKKKKYLYVAYLVSDGPETDNDSDK